MAALLQQECGGGIVSRQTQVALPSLDRHRIVNP